MLLGCRLQKLLSQSCTLVVAIAIAVLIGCHGIPKPVAEVPECDPIPIDGSYDTLSFAAGVNPEIAIETDYGTMVFELWPEVAPIRCQNFVYLTNSCFYQGLTIHRVVPGFVIQGGDPNGNGTGGPGYTIPAEISDSVHRYGTLAMAHGSDPNSAGSQFFVSLGRLTSLDASYSVFGHLIEGDAALDAIAHIETVGERPQPPVVMNRVYVRNPWW